MGGDSLMQTGRYTRQNTIRLLAVEYAEASLQEEGSGEYDPNFVITKLGAKVNRALVCGVIDRFERRDGDAGNSYSGTLRDPTGTHLFNIAPFQQELHVDAEELLSKFESNERFLMMLVGKARWYEADDGGVFTSLRAEEFSVVDKSRYIDWLIEASDSTLRRLDAYNNSLESEPKPGPLRAAGVPEDLIDGIIMSRGHYSEFDTENYLLGVRQALSMATGRVTIEDSLSEPVAPVPTLDEDASPAQENPPTPAEPTGDIMVLIVETIRSQDTGEGVEYGSVVDALVHAGHSREAAEDAIQDTRDQGEVMEPRFGFFQLVPE